MNREEILESTGIDVMSNPELWAALVDNPKLQFNEISGTLQYKVIEIAFVIIDLITCDIVSRSSISRVRRICSSFCMTTYPKGE